MHHVLRLVSKAGAVVEFLYSDKATADKAHEICRDARKKQVGAVFFDQAGRDADVDGASLFAVQLVDVQAEFLAMKSFSDEIEALKARFAPPSPPQRRAPEFDPYADDPRNGATQSRAAAFAT
jgi:hypothetical protein